MEIGSKKSKLADDAALYTHRTEKTEKAKWKEMNRKERIGYFKDYYLKKILAGIVIAAILVWIIVTMVSPKQEVVLSIAVVANSMSEEQIKKTEEDMTKRLALDEDEARVQIDSGYSYAEFDYTSQQKLSMYYMVGELDAIILPYSEFIRYAGYGWFAKLDEILPESLYAEFGDNVLSSPVYDTEGNLEPNSERICGVYIDGTDLFENLSPVDRPVLAIPDTAPHETEMQEFIAYLFGSLNL